MLVSFSVCLGVKELTSELSGHSHTKTERRTAAFTDFQHRVAFSGVFEARRLTLSQQALHL